MRANLCTGSVGPGGCNKPGIPKGWGYTGPCGCGPIIPPRPLPPRPRPPWLGGGGCRRLAEWHPDWWRCCSPERWGWWPGCLREWGSSTSHGSIVRGGPSLHRHGALKGYSPPILQSRLRSPPKAPLQPDFLRHFCGGEALACRVSFIPHGLVSGVQRGTLSSHYHEGVAKRGLH